jgi:hypothetical protein
MLDAIDDATRGAVPFRSYADGVTLADLDAALFTHKIAPAVYLHLKDDPDVPADIAQLLRERYSAQMVRQLQVQADVVALSEVLGRAGLAWAAMKGPVLAQRLWSRPDLRQYIDLDILVDRRKFGQVLDVLIADGAEMVDCNWDLVKQQVRAEVSLQLANGTSLDLHWHVVNDATLRRQFPFRTAEMLARAVPTKIGEATVPALDSVDTLLHLGYHTAHSGGHRLMWLKDVERATADEALDWDVALRRAEQYGVRLALAVVLARVNRVLGFEKPPPAAAIAPARRNAWGWFAASADRWSPVPALPSDKLSGQIVFKSTRRTAAASAAAALRVVRRRHDPVADPADNPLRVESGGTKARTAYLQLVEGAPEP